jgi:protein-L-isoaspartate(D-aspartate) O-methyltransferase
MEMTMEVKFKEERDKLVRHLKKAGYIKSERVEDAMLNVQRHLFVPFDEIKYAYEDRPLPIGAGQTISAPHMVAIMTEYLELDKEDKVLEVGAGSGYQAAIISRIVGEEGKVISIERIEGLADFARENLKRAGIKDVEVIRGDGSLGFEPEAPYDKICVTCAAPNIPEPLVGQLRVGGRMVIPVGRHAQELYLLDKGEDQIIKKKAGGVIFVPLIGRYGF